MFKSPLSFNGRIRRREYIFSFFGFILYTQLVQVFIGILIGMQVMSFPGKYQLRLMIYLGCIPALHVLIAQTVKRCHDRNNSGWWILIPFYNILLLFLEGNPHQNTYGENPKAPIERSIF
jgi:uncharacterized membrane protein YhaH (DUF805 family)